MAEAATAANTGENYAGLSEATEVGQFRAGEQQGGRVMTKRTANFPWKGASSRRKPSVRFKRDKVFPPISFKDGLKQGDVGCCFGCQWSRGMWDVDLAVGNLYSEMTYRLETGSMDGNQQERAVCSGEQSTYDLVLVEQGDDLSLMCQTAHLPSLEKETNHLLVHGHIQNKDKESQMYHLEDTAIQSTTKQKLAAILHDIIATQPLRQPLPMNSGCENMAGMVESFHQQQHKEEAVGNEMDEHCEMENEACISEEGVVEADLMQHASFDSQFPPLLAGRTKKLMFKFEKQPIFQ